MHQIPRRQRHRVCRGNRRWDSSDFESRASAHEGGEPELLKDTRVEENILRECANDSDRREPHHDGNNELASWTSADEGDGPELLELPRVGRDCTA